MTNSSPSQQGGSSLLQQQQQPRQPHHYAKLKDPDKNLSLPRGMLPLGGASGSTVVHRNQQAAAGTSAGGSKSLDRSLQARSMIILRDEPLDYMNKVSYDVWVLMCVCLIVGFVWGHMVIMLAASSVLAKRSIFKKP